MATVGDLLSTYTASSELSNLLESDRFGVISVKSYGAVGDGVTDDTDAIQDAIYAANAIGCNVYFPSGTYLYTPPLILNTNGVGLLGNSRTSTTLKPSSTAANAIEIGLLANTDNIVLKDFTLEGNGTCTNGIVFGSLTNSATYIKLDNISIESFTATNADGLRIMRSWWFVCSNSVFAGNYNNIHFPDGSVTTTVLFNGYTEIRRATNIGFLSDGTSTTDDSFSFENCSFELNTNNAIKITNPKTRTMLTNCYFEQNNNEINIVGGSGSYEWSMLYMNNCRTSSNSGYAISLDYVKNSVIRHCHNYGSAGLIVTTATCNITFEQMNNRSAANFMVIAKSLLGRIQVREFEPSTGYTVYYSSNDHYFDQHIHSTQTTKPTIEKGSAAGTNGTAALDTKATDTKGIITVTLDSAGHVAGTLCEITFNKAYSVAPVAIITPANAKAAAELVANGVYVSTTTTKLTIKFTSTDTSAGDSIWNYIIIG